MSIRLILVPACAVSLLLGACAPDLEHMTTADLAITSDAGGSIKDGGAPTADGYPVPVTPSTADYRPGPAIAAEQVAWGAPTAWRTDVLSTVDDSDGPYLLDTGDRLRIFVYGQPNLSRLYVVDHEGKIAVPLIGNVKARGKTTNQLQAAIRSRLGAEYVKDPQVTVDILQNRPFFILGEVRAAGQFPYVSGMTVETAVAIAGGYTERASEKTFRITRHVNGSVEEIEAPSDFLLKPGDTVYVFERFF
jgi:polysaccharide export outer membrane protein